MDTTVSISLRKRMDGFILSPKETNIAKIEVRKV